VKGAVLLLSYPILYRNPPVAEAAQISAPKISSKAVIGVDSIDKSYSHHTPLAFSYGAHRH
jgi:hypothetical protein